MEHLLLPHDGIIDPSERALYVADDYDNGPFLTFPQRSRFSALYDDIMETEGLDDPSRQYRDGTRIHELESFIQTWLFFGLLHEMFGTEATAPDFVSESLDGQRYLTTACLPAMIDAWGSRNAEFRGTQEGLELKENLYACITHAHRVLQASTTRIEGFSTVLCTVAALGESIQATVKATFDELGPTSRWDNLYDTDSIGKSMQSNGWCPAEVATYRRTLSEFATLYYFGKMRMPKIKDHSQCLGTTCIAAQYDSTKQSVMHRCIGRDCEILAIDDGALMSTFDQGLFGLVRFNNWQTPEEMTVSVVPFSHDLPYVAVSHVWADGLGNPSANSLPRCQLAYVAAAISSRSPHCSLASSLVWLDTLCCPVVNSQYRKQCLLRMKDIYRGASHVLVLDAQLGQLESAKVSALEVGARLQFSNWSKRLWTWQEGFLAASLWVQLRDKAVKVENAITFVYQKWDQNEYSHYLLGQYVISALEWLHNDSSKDASITGMYAALRFRAVSVPSDEALCLCAYMNIDQTAVVHAQESDRMATFWRELARIQNGIPRHILWWDGARLDTSGLRWAPASFLGSGELFEPRALTQNQNHAPLTSDGLWVHLAGYKVLGLRELPAAMLLHKSDSQEIADLRMGTVIFARETARQWYTIMPFSQKINSAVDFVGHVFKSDHATATILQENHPLGIERNGLRLGLLGSQVDSTTGAATFRIHIHVVTSPCDERMADALEIALSLIRTIASIGLKMLSAEETQEPSRFSNERLRMSRLRDILWVLSLQMIRAMIDADDTLIPLLVLSPASDPKEEAVGALMLLLRYFMYGMIREFHRFESQTWCVD